MGGRPGDLLQSLFAGLDDAVRLDFRVFVIVHDHRLGGRLLHRAPASDRPGLLAGIGVFTKTFLVVVSVVFPDLQLFNLVDEIVVGTAVAPVLLFKTLGLGFTYFCIYLLGAFFVFSSKEL